MKEIKIQLPLTEEVARSLQAGDRVLLSGELLTGRDAAHKKLLALMHENKPLPVELEGATIYYCGPCPPHGNLAVASCGPTTSSRVDGYTPTMLEKGVRGMIGKGNRSLEVIEAMKKTGAVYFAATGGAGALYAKHILSATVVAFPELGTEAVHRFTVKDFPVIVAIDSHGQSILK